MELVDRDELIAALSAGYNSKAEDTFYRGVFREGVLLGYKSAIDVASGVKAKYVRAARHALWGFRAEIGKQGYYCTHCGAVAIHGLKTDYCPVCGARMDETAGMLAARDERSLMTGHERDVITMALKTYGKNAQMAMVMEEMSELQKELCKNLRGAENVTAIAEEIADAGIMLDQMKILFNCEWDVEQVRALKVDRLQKRIASELGADDLEWVKEDIEDGT